MLGETDARRRRILYLDPAPAVGGSVISLYHLVAGLDRSRYEPVVVLRRSNSYAARFRALPVQVITFGDDGPSSGVGMVSDRTHAPWSGVRQGRLAAWLRRSRPGQALVHAAGFYLRTLPVVRADADELAAIMRAEHPDLVHLNDVVCVNRAGILAAHQCGRPAICHIRAIADRNVYDRRLSRYLRGMICISEAVDRHQRSLGGRSGPSWVVYNGLDLADFAKLEAAAAAFRSELVLLPDQPLVGCVARLVPWKGVHVFIEAVARAARQHPNLHAVVVGSPEANTTGYARQLRERIGELGLADRISMLGYRQDIAGLLGALDVLVHASVAPEPFGRILIEGMAAGAAVIGTQAGAVPEIIRQDMTGLMVPPNDAPAMAKAMLDLLAQPDRRKRMIRAAQRDVAERFTVQQYVRGVEQVYESVMS